MNKSDNAAYNKAVKNSYTLILKQIKQMLGNIEQEELRHCLIRKDKHANGTVILHELISPLVYLRLERFDGGKLGIHYGWQCTPANKQYHMITSEFVRTLYKLTMDKEGLTNIESAVKMDWVITDCHEAYEHIEEVNKHHTFQLIKYKPAQSKRKLK